MSPGRVVLLLLLGLVTGVLGTLLFEGNTGLVNLQFGSLVTLGAVPLRQLVALAVLTGIVLAGLLAFAAWLSGPFFKVALGILFLVMASATALYTGARGAAGAALLVGLLLLLAASAWEQRAALAAGAAGTASGLRGAWNGLIAAVTGLLAELASWASGFSQKPPLIAAPPRAAIGLLILLVLAPAVLGSAVLIRSALILVLAIAGIVAAILAMAQVRADRPIELRARYGGFGSGSGGWRLSQPAGLLLIAAVLFGAAGALAPTDRPPEAPPAPPPAAAAYERNAPSATKGESPVTDAHAAPARN